jgi:hypothetical protein
LSAEHDSLRWCSFKVCFPDGSYPQERYVALGTCVCCDFFQIRRSILPGPGTKKFSSLIHGHRPTGEDFGTAIAELERRGFNVRGKTPAQSTNQRGISWRSNNRDQATKSSLTAPVVGAILFWWLRSAKLRTQDFIRAFAE